MNYTCKVCGELHNELPDIGFQYPDYYFGIPEDERASRVEIGSDLCIIDEQYYFIRSVIIIPIQDYEQDFGLGVWVSQKKENFKCYVENPNTADIGPFFGWLSNNIPLYKEDTLSLKSTVHFQENKQRPLVELAPSENQLYRDYAQGISIDNLWKMIHSV